MTPNLEFYELANLTSSEALRLFDTLRNERGQVVSVTRTASGNLVVVSPFDRAATGDVLKAIVAEIDGMQLN